MPTDPNSAATAPGQTPRDPLHAAEPLRTRRQVVLNVERLRQLRGGHISLDILAAGRNRLSAAAIRRAYRGMPVTVSIAMHIARVLGCELSEIVEEEVEDDT